MSQERQRTEMREIERTIVSALIFSSDNKLLMGRKDPAKGGVYSDCWHLPGGGVDPGESFEDALKREISEEVGVDTTSYTPEPLPQKGIGITEKTLKDTGEKVVVKMEFNRFKVLLDKPADEIEVRLSDDLVEVRWFSLEELPHVKQIPGGKEFFQELGLIPKEDPDRDTSVGWTSPTPEDI
ncbi:MAG: NUDIX hydrolase [Patescibacteria group bacterium]